MLNQQTVETLRKMHLHGMAEALISQAAQPQNSELSFEERLGLLVDYEWTYRQNKRLARLLKQAKLKIPACVEDIDYHHPRGLDRSLVRTLAGCSWIQQGQNVLISGPTGIGKTYLVCALGNQACRYGFSTRYYRMPRLLGELEIARGDGTYRKFMKKLAKIDVLILDDWGLTPLTTIETRDLLEVIEDRCHNSSTIISSQLPVENWYTAMEDPTAADAVMDRVIHNAYKLALKGDSMRKKRTTVDQNEAQRGGD